MNETWIGLPFVYPKTTLHRGPSAPLETVLGSTNPRPCPIDPILVRLRTVTAPLCLETVSGWRMNLVALSGRVGVPRNASVQAAMVGILEDRTKPPLPDWLPVPPSGFRFGLGAIRCRSGLGAAFDRRSLHPIRPVHSAELFRVSRALGRRQPSTGRSTVSFVGCPRSSSRVLNGLRAQEPWGLITSPPPRSELSSVP